MLRAVLYDDKIFFSRHKLDGDWIKNAMFNSDVKVEFDNKHEDHYLRAMFPTGLKNANYADAGGHFTVDHRPIKAQGPTQHSKWPDMATLPQNNFVDISDGKRGVAFLNDSLTEYEVLEDDDRTVALSLLRAVKTWIVTGHVGSDFPSQKEGHCKGKQIAHYAIRPHCGTWQDANIPLEAELFNVPVIPIQTRTHNGNLPAQTNSFFEIENSAIRFSAFKKAENNNNFIIRVYNPTNKEQVGNLKFFNTLKNVWETNLNEDRIQEILIINDKKIMINVLEQKICSFEVEFE